MSYIILFFITRLLHFYFLTYSKSKKVLSIYFLQRGPPIIVRLGTRNLITDQGQNMDVEDVIVHPEYKEPSGYNDIALVKIAEGLTMERTLRPACLPPPTSSADKPGSSLVATGWGRTGFGKSKSYLCKLYLCRIIL